MSTLAATNLKNPSSGSNNVVLNTDGTTTIAAPSNIIKSGTAVASTSGTAIDFTSIPSWAKRVTVMFNGVSTGGTSLPQVQLGNAGGIETTGYVCFAGLIAAASVVGASYTSGFVSNLNNASNNLSGTMVLTFLGSNIWTATYSLGSPGSIALSLGGGSKTLSGILDRVRITTVNGTDTFDAGSINILYEG
jgi:hypothetical protein